MKRFLTSLMAMGLICLPLVGFVGCGEEAGVTEETTIEGPGGETTITEESTIETEGENPPIDLTTEPEDVTADPGLETEPATP